MKKKNGPQKREAKKKGWSDANQTLLKVSYLEVVMVGKGRT